MSYPSLKRLVVVSDGLLLKIILGASLLSSVPKISPQCSQPLVAREQEEVS